MGRRAAASRAGRDSVLAAATLSAALLVPVAVGATEPASKMPGAMADALADAMVAGHNAVRAGVDADLPAMAWSQPAASAARTWAGTLKEEGCAMRHDPDLEDFGQNLFWAGAKRTVTTTRDARTGAVVDREVSYAVQDVDAETVVESWAGEARWYDLATDTCRAPEGKSCGHYTQIVWAETTGVGCAMGICADKSQIWVCNYAPPGNVVGERPY